MPVSTVTCVGGFV